MFFRVGHFWLFTSIIDNPSEIIKTAKHLYLFETRILYIATYWKSLLTYKRVSNTRSETGREKPQLLYPCVVLGARQSSRHQRTTRSTGSRTTAAPRTRAREAATRPCAAGTCPAPPASWFPRRPRTCSRPGLTADHQIPPPASRSAPPRRPAEAIGVSS